MCPKPISAKTGKGERASSRPPQITKGVKRNTPVGQDASLDPVTRAYHTVLLFQTPTSAPQVCCAPEGGIAPLLQTAQGLHQEQLRKAFERAEVCHYEWYWEKPSGVCSCRTTLLPLTGPTGQVTEVMAITRDISHWGEKAAKPQRVLREGGAPKTFAQLLLAARENEKREIAKALHDEIGTASVMLSALVSLAKQSASKGDIQQVLADLERLQTQTQQSMERLRTIVVALRPPSLDTDGALRGSIEMLLADVCKLGRLDYHFQCASNMPEKGIADRVKILLYRTVQEALSNIVKHAQATCIEVTLKRQKGELFLTVQDDGIGFVLQKGISMHHVGLLAMRNSVQLLGGKLTISSKPGQGTRISAVCPCMIYEDNYEN